jgi:hypothetical protein
VEELKPAVVVLPLTFALLPPAAAAAAAPAVLLAKHTSYNFLLYVPYQLERIMIFGTLLCLYSFLVGAGVCWNTG